MSDRLTEIVIEYHPADLEAWKRGEKKKLLKDRTAPPEVYSQPEYHFGEYFVLTYFEKALWMSGVNYPGQKRQLSWPV